MFRKMETGYNLNEFGAGYSVMGSPVYRIALGELMPSYKRKAIIEIVNPNSQTGSIGFMDVIRQDRYLPNMEEIDAGIRNVLTILGIGIEPEFQGRLGYVRCLANRVESLAEEWKLNIILADSIRNPKLPNVMKRLGYEFFPRYSETAIKRLKNA